MDAVILTRDEGDALTSFAGKQVVRLDSESANYREWLVTVGQTRYCIVCEVCDATETWALLSYAPDIDCWCNALADVEAFLRLHRLILAA